MNIVTTDNFGEIPTAKLSLLPPQCKARIQKYTPAYGRLLNFIGFPHDHMDDQAMFARHLELGNLEIMKLIRPWTDLEFWDESVCSRAIRWGHLHIVKWAFLHIHSASHNVLCTAASVGNIEILEWAFEKKLSTHNAYRTAARFGQLDALKWLRAQDPTSQWESKICLYAARHGKLEVLKWVRSQDPPCPWDEWTCASAARSGYLITLKWLRGQDPPCPWDDYTQTYARIYGHPDVHQWAIDNGCPQN